MEPDPNGGKPRHRRASFGYIGGMSRRRAHGRSCAPVDENRGKGRELVCTLETVRPGDKVRSQEPPREPVKRQTYSLMATSHSDSCRSSELTRRQFVSTTVAASMLAGLRQTSELHAATPSSRHQLFWG